MNRRPHLVITLGDPCGIGPEILVRSLATLESWAELSIVGAKAGLDLLDLTSTKAEWAEAARRLKQSSTWIDPTPDITAHHLILGQGSAASGRCAVEAVRVGAQLVMDGKADALVTLPLSKAAAHEAGFDIPGHTEYLQQLAGAPMTRMAFVSPSICVVLHTVHQSLRSVVDEINAEAVAETLAFAADRFIQLTGNPDLRVALCALNPHAGEGGAFGNEETLLQEALGMAESAFLNFDPTAWHSPFEHLPSPFPAGPAPAGWELYPGETPSPLTLSRRQSGMELVSRTPLAPLPSTHPAPQFFGPLPADTVFQRAAQHEFDLVVALYHDQGLIPVKVLEATRAVNLTLGLPFIRCSPDHGTAFDKAGKWTADATNFLEASALAVRLAGRAKGQAWQASVPPGAPWK
ncbi:MAG: 4-hydroxythreonine-4-phosphate dehydrogenase PdxA [Holophaga sp.]|nr:4-hydroxythreonine-4-phosphate dehydrogenase PdxA [Holophaga sp.]